MRRAAALVISLAAGGISLPAQARFQPDWTTFEAETLLHFQELVRFDTSDLPRNEQPAAA